MTDLFVPYLRDDRVYDFYDKKGEEKPKGEIIQVAVTDKGFGENLKYGNRPFLHPADIKAFGPRE